MFDYLRSLTPPRIVLWGYLIWYLVVLVRYFDPAPMLWLNSLGISAIIGTALYLSTAHGGRSRTRLERWQIFRLYLMPLCVSSFAALIKGRGFILVFHPSLHDNAVALGLIALFLGVVGLAKSTKPEMAVPSPSLAGSRRAPVDLVRHGHDCVGHPPREGL
jgi:hypothetical protein